MANEFVHSSVGTTMTQAEFEAIGLHVCNSQATGDLIYASSSSQLSRLAIGNGVLYGTSGTPTWSTEIDNMTLDTAVAKGTWTASGTWTIPAVTLTEGSTLNLNDAAILANNSTAGRVYIHAGTNTAGAGAILQLAGSTHGSAGSFAFWTPNATTDGDVLRLCITGGAAAATATWSNVTHADLNLSDYLGLFKTDSDSAVEAELWYDDSENVLKYYNGTTVKTLATTA